MLKYQLHDHIAPKILSEDLRSANYHGRKEVGEFLKSFLRETTGDSTRAMLEYFRPLGEWLE